jgi:two-component system, NtrC family, sensor kinase
LIRIRVVIALVVVSILFLSLVYNKFEQSLFADKVENVELQMKNQISTMVTAYEAESKFLLKMAQNIANEGTRRINWAGITPYFAIAQLNDRNQLVEWFFRESSPVSSLSKETLTQVVRSFQISPESTQISYQFFHDQEKKRILLTLVPVKDKLWVFVSLGESLQSLMDNQKTLSSSLALVNKELVSVAHVKPEYIGQKIFENVVIKDLRDNNKTMSAGTFSLTSGEEFFAVMEKVPNMDLYLYTQTSLSEIIKSKEAFRRQFAFFSFGFLFILAGVLFLLLPPETKKPVVAAGPRPEIPKPVVAPAVAVADAKVAAPSEVPKDRVQNNMRIASALGHEMKAPLVKILSLVQIGNFTESKEEMFKVLNKVKSEVRAANEVVDKLLLFAGEKDQTKINTKIDTPLLRAVKNMEGIFYQKVIKITKEINATDSFDMDVNQLVTVFENILKNSIQALDRKGNKEIKIKTYSEKGNVVVLIEDNGEGIPKEISDKIFDPFFTSLNVSQHMGLGLTVALGIVKQHNGNVRVDSERGRGARVYVEFSPESVEKSASVAEKRTEAPIVQPVTSSVPPLVARPVPKDNEDVIIIDDVDQNEDEEMQEVKPPSLASRMVQPLNIPSVNDDVVLSSEDSKDSESEKNSPKEVVEHQNDDNDLFQELNLSTKPISMKPIDLNVDVDELFEVSNDVPKVDATKPPVTAPKKETAATVQAPPMEAGMGSNSFITAPKSNAEAPTRKARPSDAFNVVIRKPGKPL